MTAPAPALAARGVTTPALALALATVDTFRNQIVHCDALTLLRSLPDESVNCIVTSPPYYGLRKYTDGDAREVGLEETPEQYVARLVEIMREARRVLRGDGVCWINLGDSYAGSANSGGVNHNDGGPAVRVTGLAAKARGMGTKQLLGIPWRVAFALQADGWYLRSDVIWEKPNPMPESVTDRPTKAHEYVFLLTKSERYWYDADAVREPNTPDMVRRAALGHTRGKNGKTDASRNDADTLRGEHAMEITANGRNRRTVWTVATQPSPIPHFAMFPPALIEPCVLAGCPAEVCAECGAPYERVVERQTFKAGTDMPECDRDLDRGNWQHGNGQNSALKISGPRYKAWREANPNVMIGFRPTCDCHATTRPGIVLDPFMGVGTTALVAIKHGRDYIGGDLNAASVEWARLRISYGGDDRRMMADREAGVRQMTLAEAAR